MVSPSGSGTDRDSDTTASESDTDTASSTGSDSEADTTFSQRPGASQRDVSPNANNMAEQIAGALATAKTAKSDTYVPLTAQKYKPLSQLTTDQEHTEFPKHGSQVLRKREDSDEEDESDSDSESGSNSDSSSREDTVPSGRRTGGMPIENKPRSKFSFNLPL